MTTENAMITIVIESKQEREFLSMDILSAFVQTKDPQDHERISMKIRGALVDMLLKVGRETTKTS